VTNQEDLSAETRRTRKGDLGRAKEPVKMGVPVRRGKKTMPRWKKTKNLPWGRGEENRIMHLKGCQMGVLKIGGQGGNAGVREKE